MAKWPHKAVYPLNQDETERFLSGFDRGLQDECWPWKRSANSMGYGQIQVHKGMRLAHRVSWAFANKRDIPRSVVICHRCDNPICVNPRHLFSGNQQANIQDAMEKGRSSPPPRHVGINHPACTLTVAQVLEIRAAVGGPTEIAKRLGVTANQVKSIRARRTWKHVA